MNKIMLIGRLTRDPEIRYSTNDNNTAIARYTLAVNRPFRKNGEQQADFLPCIAFGKTAEFAENILQKECAWRLKDAYRLAAIPTGTDRKSTRRTLWWNGRSFWRRGLIIASQTLALRKVTMTDLWISRTGLTKSFHSINR